MKKIFIMMLVLFMAVSSMNAVKWDAQTKKAFRKAESYSLFVDFSKAKIGGLDSTEFVSYYCDKKQVKPNFLDILYKKFRYELSEEASEVFKKNVFVGGCSSEFVFSYVIFDITEKAGIKGELRIYPKDRKDLTKVYDFRLKDGKWNTFENLFLETAEELGEQLIEIKNQHRFGSPKFYIERNGWKWDDLYYSDK